MKFLGFDVHTLKGRIVYLIVGVGVSLLCWLLTKTLYTDPRDHNSLNRVDGITTNVASFFFMGSFGAIVMWTVVVRTACKHAVMMQTGTCSIIKGETSTVFETMVIDSETKYTVLKWATVAFTAYLVPILFGGGIRLAGLLGTVSTVYLGLFRILPRASERWCPSNGRRLISVVRRGYIIVAVVGGAPAIALPWFMHLLNPHMLVLYYPLFLSFIEFLVVSVFFSNAVVKGLCPEVLGMIGRLYVASFEASRVGLLVVITNAEGGELSGFVAATAWSALLGAFSRLNLIANFGFIVANLVLPSSTVQALVKFIDDQNNTSEPPPASPAPSSVLHIHNSSNQSTSAVMGGGNERPVAGTGVIDDVENSDHGMSVGVEVGSAPPPRAPTFTTAAQAQEVESRQDPREQKTDNVSGGIVGFSNLQHGFILPQIDETFKLVYLGCKAEVELWTPIILLYLRVLNWGYPQVGLGVDKETGELPKVLVVSWAMLAIVVAGEVLGELLITGLGSVILRYAPRLAVHTPTVFPGRDIRVHVAVWMVVGTLFMIGICGMAPLVNNY